MTLRISFLTFLLTVSAVASAKKWYQPIETIASQADYIVVGEIVTVQAGTYQFSVAEYVKGSGSRTLTVQQFEEWTCDQRYAKPAKGQRLFLFLKKDKTGLELINGSSGELPILHNRVTLEHDTYAYERGQPFLPYSMDWQEFKTGMKLFVRCFNIQVDPVSSRAGAAMQLGNNEEVNAFRSTNNFTGWLYERITKRYTIAKK